MKNSIYLLLITLIFSCEPTDTRYAKALRNMNEGHLRLAQTTFSFVDKDSPFYDEAQLKIDSLEIILNRLDSIERIKRERADSVKAAQAIESKITEAKSNLKYVRNFKNSTYRDEKILRSDMDRLAKYASICKNAKNSGNEELNKLGLLIEKELKSKQSIAYPKMRKGFAEILGKKLWRDNIEVEIRGSRSTTLRLIGGIFANNANKEDFQEELRSSMKNLRFKRVEYLWYEYDDKYTYYTISSLNDASL